MPTQIFTHIDLLVNTRTGNRLLRGHELAVLPCIKNAYIVIEDDIIAEYGDMDNFKYQADSTRIPESSMILPCWCDSHTHLVFAGSRENEFVDKLKGLSYADI